MAPPVTVDDTVFYTQRNLYLDKPVIVTLLDGSQLEIWGPVFVNGNPLATIGSLPIATQPEAEAGVDNTKVMTPLRTKQSITANAPGGSGAVASVNGKTGVVVVNQDEVLNGSTYVQYSQTEKTKLSGVATGATANSTDATLLARANHTGTQSADTIVDGTTNKTFSAAEDTKLAGIATGATANATDAQLRDRSTHTGTQSADTLTDGTTNKAFLATERTKLTGIATGATANSSDATLLSRTNHTGFQAESTVTNLVTDLAAKMGTAGGTFSGDISVPDEVYGSGWDASLEVPTKNALYDKIEALVAGGGGLTQEQVEDMTAALFAAGTHTNATVTYNDATPSLSVAVTGLQPVDTDLTTIAGLTATTDNLIQSVAGAWASRTPAQVKTVLAIAESDVTNLVTDLSNKQPLDTDLTTIAGLTATTDNMIQSVGSAWASRTPAQLKTTLALVKADVGLGSVDNTSDAGKPVSTAQQTALDLKVNLNQTINAQTGTTYTLALTDNGKLVTLDNAAAIALTVPTNASAAFPVGSRIDLVQRGAGQVTVGGTPTINSTPTKKSRAQYSGMTLVKELTDTWYLFGDLSAT